MQIQEICNTDSIPLGAILFHKDFEYDYKRKAHFSLWLVPESEEERKHMLSNYRPITNRQIEINNTISRDDNRSYDMF